MGDVVIVAYRPKTGCDAALRELVLDHVPTLRRLGLATDRPNALVQAEDGVVLEMFEWAEGAIARAHGMPAMIKLWRQYAAVCDIVPLRELPESASLFAQFAPLDVQSAPLDVQFAPLDVQSAPQDS